MVIILFLILKIGTQNWTPYKNGSGHVVVGHPYSGSNGNLKVMDCGPKPVGKNECQGWNYSFGPKKRNKVEFFV